MRADLGVHARQRAQERTDLLLRETRRIIENGHCVALGPNRGRSHILCKLFFSKADEEFFVAFHDVNTGKVISVWPLEYLREYKPTKRQKEVARRRAEGIADESREVKSFRKKFPKYFGSAPRKPASPERLLKKNLDRLPKKTSE